MTNELVLRAVEPSDLLLFFHHQLDPEATRMAAFASRSYEAFMSHWEKGLADHTTILKTIVFQEKVAGNIVCWGQPDERKVGYWLGREYWGKGIASASLAQFLKLVVKRPLFARVAKHNRASIRVLEKCGFVVCGEDKFSDTSGNQIEESIFRIGST